jgi:Mucin-2 protein WxxW repeating region
MLKKTGLLMSSLLALSLAVPASATTTTPWLDRDNPGGSGDWENLTGLVTKVECAFTATGLPTSGPAYRCDVMGGSQCINTAALVCQDTKVQYTFDDLLGRKVVTGWLNRDLPSGTGDWENPSALFTVECKFTDNGQPVPNSGAYICGAPDSRSGGIGVNAKNGGKPVRNIAVRFTF